MIIRNRAFRNITLFLQIIAIAAFFIPSLLARDNIGVFWLLAGIIHAFMFCAVFFRDSRRRTALSVILTILVIIWCLILSFAAAFVYLLLAPEMGIDVNVSLVVYIVSSFFAMIFALSSPRKYDRMTQEANLLYPGMTSKYNR